MAEVIETINRIKTHKFVQGVVVVNNDGMIVRTTYNQDKKEEGEALARNIPQLVQKAKQTLKEVSEGREELTFLRVRTKYHEIMVSPGADYMLIVVQGQKKDKFENE